LSESAYARINPYSYLTASAYARVFCMCELLTVSERNGTERNCGLNAEQSRNSANSIEVVKTCSYGSKAPTTATRRSD